jgi:four helix bundle protein
MHQRPYEKLIVWQEAHNLCLWIYEVTRSFPAQEKYRLVGQMCRSAYSIPTIIAEGNARRSKRDKAHFLETALASLEELHYQCILSRDLQYLTPERFVEADDHLQRVSYLLTKLRTSLISSDSSVSSVSSVSS